MYKYGNVHERFTDSARSAGSVWSIDVSHPESMPSMEDSTTEGNVGLQIWQANTCKSGFGR